VLRHGVISGDTFQEKNVPYELGNTVGFVRSWLHAIVISAGCQCATWVM